MIVIFCPDRTSSLTSSKQQSGLTQSQSSAKLWSLQRRWSRSEARKSSVYEQGWTQMHATLFRFAFVHLQLRPTFVYRTKTETETERVSGRDVTKWGKKNLKRMNIAANIVVETPMNVKNGWRKFLLLYNFPAPSITGQPQDTFGIKGGTMVRLKQEAFLISWLTGVTSTWQQAAGFSWVINEESGATQHLKLGNKTLQSVGSRAPECWNEMNLTRMQTYWRYDRINAKKTLLRIRD